MKGVLLITTAYLPQQGGGIIRPSRLAKYLPDWQWNPVILTMQPPKSDGAVGRLISHQNNELVYRAPRMDIIELYHTIKKSVSSCLQFFKKLTISKNISSKVIQEHAGKKTTNGDRRKADYIFVPDTRIFWIPGATLFGMTAIIKKNLRVIYSMSPDPSAHIVGLLLKSITKKPWVAEFRDPWITNPFKLPSPYRWMDLVNARLERLVIEKADRIVVTSNEYKEDFLLRYHQLSEEKVLFVPNGFDLDDFEKVITQKLPKLTIVHAGNFYMARSSVSFINGLNLFLKRNPEARSQIQVVCIGVVDDNGQDLIYELGLEDVIEQKGILPHNQAIKYICDADILLLVPGPGKGTTPGKIYEYMAAKKPILALADEGRVRDLIISSGIGLVVPPDDINEIMFSIESLYNTVITTGYSYPDISEFLRIYDRRNIAGQVAEILNSL